MKRLKIRNINYGPEINWDTDLPDDQVNQYISDHEHLFGKPGEYTIETTDVTSEYRKKDLDAYVKERTEKADADIQALLGEMQDTTHLMMSLYDLTIATNVLGNASADDIAAAKQRIVAALQLMEQVNQVRIQRDAEIAAYLSAHPVE